MCPMARHVPSAARIRSITAETSALIPTKLFSTIKTFKYSSLVVHGGEVCYMRFPRFDFEFETFFYLRRLNDVWHRSS